MKRRLSTQGGFTLPATIFILVILASVSAFLLTISAVSHTSSSLALQGARAYYAAYSGLEWATYLATKSQGDHDRICAHPGYTPPGPTRFDIVTPTGTGLAGGFTVTVTCVDGAASYSEGGNSYVLDKITVTAATKGVKPGEPDYASRVLTATVTTGSQLP